MSDLDPSGPSQPTVDQAYTTQGNPASKAPAEAQKASQTAQQNAHSQSIDQRIPQKQAGQDEAQPSALGRGVRGAGTGEEGKGLSDEDVGRHNELDGQQMAMPGEGRVYEAVEGDTSAQGRSGSQPDFVSDLDRKKAEQAPLREAREQERQKNVDVGGVLGQTGGPANPVDKDNYPNTGSG